MLVELNEDELQEILFWGGIVGTWKDDKFCKLYEKLFSFTKNRISQDEKRQVLPHSETPNLPEESVLPNLISPFTSFSI